MRIRGAVVGVAALAVLGLTGCGSAEQTAAGGSGSAGGGSAATLTSDNFVDTVTKSQLEAKSTHVEMDVESSGQSVEGAGDVALGKEPADTQMAMTMTMPGMGDEFEMRLVDQVLYMNMGAMTQGKFAKLDLSDPNNPMGKSFGQMLSSMDPTKSMEKFDGAITSFEKAGDPEQIDGVQAQPYEVVVDTQKMGEQAGGFGAGAASLPDELTFTYWIGSDDLPRKLTSNVANADVEVTFTDWGKDVDVSAPSPAQITDQNPFAGMPPKGGPNA